MMLKFLSWLKKVGNIMSQTQQTPATELLWHPDFEGMTERQLADLPFPRCISEVGLLQVRP